jgi:nitroreductase
MAFNIKNPETLDLLLSRRSAKSKRMHGPGPTPEELDKILSAAMRVPDHGKLAPWRFHVFETKESQEKLGKVFGAAYEAEETNPQDVGKDALIGFPAQAPVLVVVTSHVNRDHKVPAWEQVLSSGAVGQNLLIATHAMGYLGQWLTGWAAFSPTVKAHFSVEEKDGIVGFFFLGSCDRELKERPRPDFDDVVKRY